MVVGVLRIRLRLPGNRSLKGKRKVIKSLVSQVGNRFNVAVAEVADNDMWQSAEIGIGAVGNSEQLLNSILDKIVSFIEERFPCEMVSSEMEFIHMGEMRG